MLSNPGHAVLEGLVQIAVMVGNIQNDPMLSTTFFSLQVELGSNEPPFMSDS